MLTAERLRELLHYDSETGTFTWLKSGPGRRSDLVAGWLDGRGYREISIDGCYYVVHRLAWLYMTGEWPPFDINGDPSDNCMCNLRLATRSQNLGNQRAQSNTASWFKGVSWDKRTRKWQARVQVNGKRINLGYFDKPHIAYSHYCLAARRHYGEFARCYDADMLVIPHKVFEERVLRNLLIATQPELAKAA